MWWQWICVCLVHIVHTDYTVKCDPYSFLSFFLFFSYFIFAQSSTQSKQWMLFFFAFCFPFWFFSYSPTNKRSDNDNKHSILTLGSWAEQNLSSSMKYERIKSTIEWNKIVNFLSQENEKKKREKNDMRNQIKRKFLYIVYVVVVCMYVLRLLCLPYI